MRLFALIGIFHMYVYTLHFQSRHLVGFVVVSILAFYTVPTYIHCFMSVCAFGLYEWIRQGHWRCVGRIIKAGLCTALGTVVLYWPIVLFSGIESLLANQWVTYEAARFQDIFIISVVETVHYGLGTPAKGYYLAAVLTVAFAYALVKTSRPKPASLQNPTCFNSNVARWLRLMVISVVTTLIIILHRVYPPYRVWTYFSFLCQITLAILFVFYLKVFADKIRPRTQLVLLLLACVIQPGIGLAQYHWKERQPESIETEQAYRKRERAISYLMSRQPSAVLTENTEAGIDYFLRFRCIVEQQTLRIDVLERADWQSRYDFVICHPENFPEPLALADFQPLLQVRQTVVYERKEAR
jgi:hypothetical protein